MTQYMARVTSPTQGKDGTCHFGDLKTRHVVSPISMLGDLIPVMTGVAMAGRYLGQKIVAMTWIGDGGTSTGAFHEGMNLAAVQRAPLVVVLENNQWAYSTPVNRQAPLRDFADRARAYGIASYTVDGNDLVAVLRIAREAVERARQGDGPVLIEAKDHAHAGPRAARSRGVCAARDARVLEGARSFDAATKSISISTSCGTKKKKPPYTRASNVNWPRIWSSRRIPHFLPPELAEQGVYCQGCHSYRSGLAPRQRRADAAEVQRQAGVDDQEFWRDRHGSCPSAIGRIATEASRIRPIEPAVAHPAQTDRKRKIAAPATRRARR